MNILIYLSIFLIVTLLIYFMNKLLGKLGLLIILSMMNVISLVLSFKLIKFSNFSVISNSITYISIFTIIYLLLPKTNQKELKKIININFVIAVFSSILLYLTSLYVQSISDTTGINMTNVFIRNPRILFAYPTSLLLSSHLSILIYNKIKKIYDNMFISITTTYLVVGLIDIIIYILIAYYNLYKFKVLLEILLSTYMVRLILTVIHSIIQTITSKRTNVKR